MFGAIYGDIIGSYYELHCTKNYDFPFEKSSTFTDDSVLTAAVCQAILQQNGEICRRELRRRAFEYASQYRQFYARFPHAGFGNMFAAWAKEPYAKNQKSYANGGAMRVVPIGYAYDTLEQTLLQVKASCLPTHKHRDAVKAAKAVATAVFLARHGKTKEQVRTHLQDTYKYDLSVPLASIRKTHVFDSKSSYSVPPAIIAFLESDDYESAVRNAVSLGGDADTQACIAGGIAEAFYGEIPAHIKHFCDPKIDSSIKNTVKQFADRYCKPKQ